ncbi:MAG: efflux RND transporter permease subunit [Gammaproteobacteria bacterium]|nr:efflux RND transporter permease subunit [Gammaproteobacteria bacterium]
MSKGIRLHFAYREIMRVIPLNKLRDFTSLAVFFVISLGACSSLSSSVTHSKTLLGISISADNLSPGLIEQQIAIPLETELRHIQSVERVSIHVVRGFVCFQISIDSTQDQKSAHADVTSAVERIAPTFPHQASKPEIEILNEEINESLCPARN